MTRIDILLIEDNAKLATSLVRGLEDAGFSVRAAGSGEEAMAAIESAVPGLILLDLGLPDTDGIDLFGRIKDKLGDVPIIITTARGAIEDRVKGLELGSDDYLVKPFAFPELVARVRAVVRRAEGAHATVLTHGELKMDVVRRALTVGGEPVELPLREFSLLQHLLEHKGEVVSRDMLADKVWKINRRATSLDNAIDVHVSRLRLRLKECGMEGIVKTVRGSGFMVGDHE